MKTTNKPAMNNKQKKNACINRLMTRLNGKALISFSMFICCSLLLNAQNKPANRATNRPPISASINDTTGETQIEERLVALALNGPTMQAVVHEGRINEFELRGAKNAWMNLLTVSANYNEFSLQKNTNNNIVFPRYFFGVTIPLGTILSRTQVKAATEAVEINKLNQEDKRRTIRADVLSKYKQYKAYNTLITLQNESLSDVEAALLQSEESFRKGTISIDAYNTAQKAKGDALERLVNLRLQKDIVELEIERLIGTDLESVIKK
jgi:outer membrane protein TolC